MFMANTYPLTGKRVLIVGYGTTGKSLVKFLSKQQCEISISEKGKLPVEDGDLNAPNIKWEEGGHTPAFFSNQDLIVVSPGIPTTLPIFAAAKEQKIPIISEIELASSLIQKPIIGVTGTNGKTTVVNLLQHLLTSCGLKSALTGNVGTPLIDLVNNQSEYDVFVVELSSFQLETIKTLRPFIGIYLNLAKDHFERYEGLSDYHQAKMRLFKNQAPTDYALFNGNQAEFKQAKTNSTRLFFNSPQCLVKNNQIEIQFHNETHLFDLTPTQIKGEHNEDNFQVGLYATLLFLKVIHPDKFNKAPALLQSAIESFAGLEHRNEFIDSYKGVSFYNDSKATNPAATVSCLTTFPDQKVILLVGGQDKQTGYEELIPLAKTKVKKLIAFGEAKDIIYSTFSKLIDCTKADSLSQALDLASGFAKEGDVITMSPACSSFDAFSNYKERGIYFKKLVHDLISTRKEGDHE